ncbi:hypothetical protein DFR72_111182 [Lentzea flaviverrucosa]|uniref:Uncharacterized protein n=1 Tax=Lentzea flaviverrucosa TaxID=200379 RepID=A0A1H9WSS3_9PSEU|nr:hypothetical protein DFR72_111182 [Lentzea flaviverrucosa]SES36717.1 hypothetical protein SAMN05216195_112177 [Lentzea flaviverrucosa]
MAGRSEYSSVASAPARTRRHRPSDGRIGRASRPKPSKATAGSAGSRARRAGRCFRRRRCREAPSRRRSRRRTRTGRLASDGSAWLSGCPPCRPARQPADRRAVSQREHVQVGQVPAGEGGVDGLCQLQEHVRAGSGEDTCRSRPMVFPTTVNEFHLNRQPGACHDHVLSHDLRTATPLSQRWMKHRAPRPRQTAEAVLIESAQPTTVGFDRPRTRGFTA